LFLLLILQSSQSRQKSEAIESQMNELRRDLQSVATRAGTEHRTLETIAKGVAQRLDSVTPALQDAIRNSAQITGQMTSDAQTKMADELKNTRDQISQIQKQLGAVELAGQQMSQTAQTLERHTGRREIAWFLWGSHSGAIAGRFPSVIAVRNANTASRAARQPMRWSSFAIRN